MQGEVFFVAIPELPNGPEDGLVFVADVEGAQAASYPISRTGAVREDSPQYPRRVLSFELWDG